MQNGAVFDFARKGPWTLEQASDLVGVLNRITIKHSKSVNSIISRLETIDPKDRTRTSELEALVNREIEEWNVKIRKLGAVPKGLWLVDIDSGDGYYCWKFPEDKINYWHDYKSGYSGRIPITERPNAHSTSTDQSLPGVF